MRYILVGSGINNLLNCYQKEVMDEIWAIDGGIKALYELKIIPNYFIGDNDSANLTNIKVTKETIILNPCKDVSDLEACLEIINSKYKGEEINIYNVTGGRCDHFLANIRLLIKYHNMHITIIDNQNKIYLISENNEYKIKKSQYKYVSFFNIYDDTVISLNGFKYNLNNYHLERFNNLCLSNEIINEGVVTTNKKLICIEAN